MAPSTPAVAARVTLLARVPFFASLPPAELRALAALATARHLRAGQRALARDSSHLVVLLTGRLEVLGGDDEPVRSLVPPALVGVSLAAGAAGSAELRAGEASSVLVLPNAAVTRVLRLHPQAALAAIAHLAAVVAALTEEVAALRRHGAVARVRYRLRTVFAGRRQISITHAQLAAQTGLSRANVSRALARLAQEGVLRRTRGRLELLRDDLGTR